MNATRLGVVATWWGWPLASELRYHQEAYIHNWMIWATKTGSLSTRPYLYFSLGLSPFKAQPSFPD
jgi:hypothetical protein